MKHVFTKIRAGLLLLSSLQFAYSCQKNAGDDNETPGPMINVSVQFKAVVDAELLQFDKPYKNNLQETYSVKTFKYYISGIELINSQSGKVYPISNNSYFLI